MRLIITILFFCCAITSNSQLLSWSPDFIQESADPVVITMDGLKGNKGLKDYLPTDVYVHMGVITTASTSSSDWKYSKFTWGTTNASAKAVSAGTNKWNYTITGGLRAFFGIIDPNEKILKIALLFRNGSGSRVQRNADGSDMYIPVYDAGLNVRITDPLSEPKYKPTPEPITKNVGDAINITAKANAASDIKVYLNQVQVGVTATGVTSYSTSATIAAAGQQIIVAEAMYGGETKYDTIKFFVYPAVTTAALPAGVRDGINYDANNTSVTLVLYAPNKTRVSVIGDINDWTETLSHQLNKTPDGLRYWITINGLTPGIEYAYQYVIDGTLKVADYMTEKVLDPFNDQYIPVANYPALKPYPTGKTSGIVSVLQTAKPAYTWQVPNFTKPDKRNLVIYELLVRDFVATQNWTTVKDSIAYLKKLGITAIEVMPFNEFEGNLSWGYNPDYYFAPDKMYGTENALRQFIDECHKQGIAVIMDIALNHAFGLSPTVQMYFNSTTNKPAANNPWHNVDAKHPFNVGYDFNHESPATKDLVDRVVEHWLTKYKIDGFRWDLSKGFTQTNNPSNVGAWGNYDASRVAIWKRIYDKMQAVAPSSYCILEHFADNSEEIELSNYGMMLWGNSNHDYSEGTMGYPTNLQYGIFTNRGWSNPTLITYQESHDEERLMYKNITSGNVNGGYNVKNIATGLKRNEMAAAFWAMTPAPKMIWQFGELGYDYSINTCGNLTVNTSCRTDNKPIKWDYLQDANRKALYDVYSKLLTLRKVPDYLPAFVSNSIGYNLGGYFKWLQVTTNELKICVIGNFDVVPVTGTVTFQNPGTWYNYLQGGTRNATGSPESITLQPGEYYVYLDRDASSLVAALPLKLLSFSAARGTDKIAVNWVTSNEINVKHFELQRSMNGADFTSISTVPATNRQGNQAVQYAYNDKELSALQANTKVYYRLKMTDRDGAFTYSSIQAINPLTKNAQITAYPNPVKGSLVYLQLDKPAASPIVIKVEDITGRLYSKFTVNASDFNYGSIPVNVQSLSSGSYVLKVETGKSTSVKQIIVQH
ncbi:MAG: T9SS type A sorting domain-containing protein [Chitinophagaceae bacterium]|nr:T9SS type A sorting domain-containing protein [Chitinophagaceae bacterium]